MHTPDAALSPRALLPPLPPPTARLVRTRLEGKARRRRVGGELDLAARRGVVVRGHGERALDVHALERALAREVRAQLLLDRDRDGVTRRCRRRRRGRRAPAARRPHGERREVVLGDHRVHQALLLVARAELHSLRLDNRLGRLRGRAEAAARVVRVRPAEAAVAAHAAAAEAAAAAHAAAAAAAAVAAAAMLAIDVFICSFCRSR